MTSRCALRLLTGLTLLSLANIASSAHGARCCPSTGPLRVVTFSADRLRTPLGGFCTNRWFAEARLAAAEGTPLGLTCAELDAITPEALSRADVFVALMTEGAWAASPLDRAEQDALEAFLVDGGSLFLVGENGLYRIFQNSIASVVGAEFMGTSDSLVEVERRVSHPVLNGPAGRAGGLRQAAGGKITRSPSDGVVLAREYYGVPFSEVLLVAQGVDEGAGCGAVVIWCDANSLSMDGGTILQLRNRKFVTNTFAWFDSIHRDRDHEGPQFVSIDVRPPLWPPNHRMVTLALELDIVVSVFDECDPNPVVRIVGVQSNEPEDATGDGHTRSDCWFDDESVSLRAERRGGGSGRIYTITLEARDARGNVSSEEVEIAVPHDQREGGSAAR